MNPAARLSIALVVGLALWWPSFNACMRGTMDLPEAALRYLVAFLFARVAVAFLARLVGSYAGAPGGGERATEAADDGDVPMRRRTDGVTRTAEI